MKKLAIIGSIIASFLTPIKSFAADTTAIVISTPEAGFSSLGNAINNILILAFAIASIIVLVMLILGAFEWITSGGDKEAVGKARGRIINALIGLAVLAVAFALARVAGQFTGINLFNLAIPSPISLPNSL